MMRRLLFCVLAIVCIAAGRADAAELYDRNGQSIDITVPPTWPAPPGLRRQPVLFVHGHAEDSSADPNYRKNFWEDADDDLVLAFFNLTSLKETLDDPINSGLDIEAYYIRFDDRTRSITDDAFDIGQVVDYIVRRHNENFDPATATMPPPVQVAIIGYSKGTISTRQYLKSLQVQVQDNGGISMPAPRPGYRPVSEFIAIAPPNHGISSSFFSEATDQISIQQLYNGVQPEGSWLRHPVPEPLSASGKFHRDPERRNGARSAGFQRGAGGWRSARVAATKQGPHSGTLYVTIFDNRDLVGGDSPSTTDCPGAGRGFASNLVLRCDQHSDRRSRDSFRDRASQHAAHAGRRLQSPVCGRPSSVSGKPDLPAERPRSDHPAAATPPPPCSRSTSPAACWRASAQPVRPATTSSGRRWQSLRSCGRRPDDRTIASA